MRHDASRINCAHRVGHGWTYRPRSLADVRQLLIWATGKGPPAPPVRRHVVESVMRYLVELDAQMRDRERGCVALLLDAAQRVGEASKP